MPHPNKYIIGKFCVILAVIPILIKAYSSGPDPGKSGVPGEGGVCTDCHLGTDLNAGGGSVKISTGAPTYTPGVKQQIRVTISDPTQRRWGFQLTARLASDPTVRAGVLASPDSKTLVICAASGLQQVPCTSSPALQYIEHSLAGAVITDVGAGNTFSFDWTPPDANVGPVVLYAAGNAANANTREDGDHIYTTTLTLNPAAAAAATPVISDVVHDGSFEPGISSNGFVVIRGSNLSASTRTWESKDFQDTQLPTSLDGTSVKINGKDAFVYSVSPTQITALCPVDDGTGSVNVQVTVSGATSDSASVDKRTFTPAFFLFNNDKYIVARHPALNLFGLALVGPATLYPGLSAPAKPGETISLYGTGFGPTDPAIVNGQLLSGTAKLINAVTVRIGDVDVTPSFAGLTSTGVYQFNVKLPDSTPDGDVPVVTTINNSTSQSKAFIAVQR